MLATLKYLGRLYLLLSVLAGVPASASQGVLCLAPHGHVAIEAGVARCVDYATCPADGAFEHVGARGARSTCGDCVDIPVGTPMLGEGSGHGNPRRSQTAGTAPFLAAALEIDSPATTTRACSAQATIHWAGFASSRMTILRS
jgi:hypothetical protein